MQVVDMHKTCPPSHKIPYAEMGVNKDDYLCMCYNRRYTTYLAVRTQRQTPSLDDMYGVHEQRLLFWNRGV